MGDYERRGVVVRGAAGTVWSGFDRVSRREVALKRLSGADAGAAARHGAVLADLAHPNIVAVYDVYDDEAGTWLVEQWVHGAPLRTVLARSDRLSTVEALALGRGVLSGLAHAHDRGVVHGGLSAASVLVAESGAPMVADFDVSGVGGVADERSDVYSACALLAELLTGERLSGDSARAEANAEDVTRILSGIEAPVAEVLAKGLEVGPRHRPPDAAALLALLDEAAERTLGTGWLAKAGLGALGSTAAALGAALPGFGGAVGGAAAAGVGAAAGAGVGAAGVGSSAGAGLGSVASVGAGSAAGLGTGAGSVSPLGVGSAASAVNGKVLIGLGAGAAVVAAGVAVVLLWPDTQTPTASVATTTTTTTTTTEVVVAAPPLPPPPPAGPLFNGTYDVVSSYGTATINALATVTSACPGCDATMVSQGYTTPMRWNGAGWSYTVTGGCGPTDVVVTPVGGIDGPVPTLTMVGTFTAPPAGCVITGAITGTFTRTGD